MHYVGSLPDGTLFASTRDGEPRTINLGSGDVVAGLERGICTVKKGEKALFMLPPLAYEDSSAPGVPTDSELHFEVELLSWLTVVDIYRNGGICKEVLSTGGNRQTGDLDEVTVKYKVKLLDESIVEESPEEGSTFFVNQGDVCPALPKVLKTMKEGERAVDGAITKQITITGNSWIRSAVATMVKGELAKVTVKFEYGFGRMEVEVKRQLATVPPCSTLIYEAELIDFTKEKESWEMNAHEKLEAAEKLKVAGNDLFKIGKFQSAAKKYNKALNYVNEDGHFEDEHEKLIKTLRVSCWLNHAACCLKLKDLTQAISLCSKILEVESCNVKALYRRAQAYGEAYDMGLAKTDVLKALELDPNNKEVKLLQANM